LEIFVDQNKPKRSIREFVKEHKTKILVGVVIIFAVANSGLKKDVKELKKDNKELQSKIEDNNDVVRRASADLARFETMYGPYRY
jgi:ribonuclease P protein component